MHWNHKVGTTSFSVSYMRMKLFAIHFPCCLIFSLSTSHISGKSTFDYGYSSSLKTSLPNTTILISDSHIQQAVMFIAISATLFYGSQRFKFSNSRFSVSFRLKFCYMHNLGLALRVIKNVRLEKQPAIFEAKMTDKNCITIALQISVYQQFQRVARFNLQIKQ